jgi:lysozyme family protein
MTVVFREIEKRELPVEYVIVLTDGYTPFGEDPGIPTIWCITTDVVAPWGETVHVKL